MMSNAKTCGQLQAWQVCPQSVRHQHMQILTSYHAYGGFSPLQQVYLLSHHLPNSLAHGQGIGVMKSIRSD